MWWCRPLRSVCVCVCVCATIVHLPPTTLDAVVMVTHQMLLLKVIAPPSLSLMSCNDSRLARSPVAVVSKAGAVGRDMQRHRGRRSVATAMASGARRRDRRHSAPDVLLKALRRRRSSALETLSASLHRAMAAVSVKQLERGARRCNRHTDDIALAFRALGV